MDTNHANLIFVCDDHVSKNELVKAVANANEKRVDSYKYNSPDSVIDSLDEGLGDTSCDEVSDQQPITESSHKNHIQRNKYSEVVMQNSAINSMCRVKCDKSERIHSRFLVETPL